MKTLKTLFAFSLVTFFLSAYVIPEKNAAPVPFITFITDAGDEKTKPLTETTPADWKDEVKLAEFRMGEQVVEFEGIIVISPKVGDAIMMAFKENSGFTTSMQKIGKAFEFVPGDRFILDNIKIVGQKKAYTPIVHTLK